MPSSTNESSESTHTILDFTVNLGGGSDGQEGRIRSKISKNPPKLDKSQASKISGKWSNGGYAP